MKDAKHAVNIIEVPDAPARIAMRQCAGIVKHYGRLAQFGSLDLSGLAMSCYLQGAVDCIEAARNNPRLMELGTPGRKP